MEQNIKTMIGFGIIGVVLPFLGIPMVFKLYLLSLVSLVYTLLAVRFLYTHGESNVFSEKTTKHTIFGISEAVLRDERNDELLYGDGTQSE
jgi:uncharacterized membrane protein